MLTVLQRREFVAEREAPRLDRWLASLCPDLSRSQLARLIHDGWVTVNSSRAKPSQRLRQGDKIELTLPPPAPATLEPELLPLAVVYEDDDLLVVDKPAGLPVHPGPGHPSHTLVNVLLAICPHLSGIGGILRPGIVHRLDKDTSGLMMVAKNDAAHRALARQLEEHHVDKTYVALVWGTPVPRDGTVEAAIGRDPKNRKRMAVLPDGRPARTRYRVLKQFADTALLEAFPETGRTHQVRVHLAFIGHPIVGDPLYSRRRTALVARQSLHASRLRFRLPSTGEAMEFAAPLPADLQAALEALERGLPATGS